MGWIVAVRKKTTLSPKVTVTRSDMQYDVNGALAHYQEQSSDIASGLLNQNVTVDMTYNKFRKIDTQTTHTVSDYGVTTAQSRTTTDNTVNYQYTTDGDLRGATGIDKTSLTKISSPKPSRARHRRTATRWSARRPRT